MNKMRQEEEEEEKTSQMSIVNEGKTVESTNISKLSLTNIKNQTLLNSVIDEETDAYLAQRFEILLSYPKQEINVEDTGKEKMATVYKITCKSNNIFAGETNLEVHKGSATNISNKKIV